MTLKGFVTDRAANGAEVYTDEATAYHGLTNHEIVNHSVGEYVARTSANGLRLFWAMLQHGHRGAFHRFSAKHLNCYVKEFASHHNIRNLDVIEHVAVFMRGFIGQRLKYQDLIASTTPLLEGVSDAL